MLYPVWALLLVAPSLADAREELKQMQGKWKVTKLVIDGQPGPKEALGAAVTIKGDTLTVTLKRPDGKEETRSMTMHLDPTRTPKQIDMKPARDVPALGIYELKGNTLTICGADPPKSKDRPARFESKKGEHRVLFVLTRVK